VILNDAVATDLKVYIRHQIDFIYPQDIRIGGVSVTAIPGIVLDTLTIQYYNIIGIDFSGVDSNFAPGVIFDADGDGYYDDLSKIYTFIS